MDRADKIFTIMAALGLVALLVYRRGGSSLPNINASALPALVDNSGPAYLVSNLPAHRDRDEQLPYTSYPEYWGF